MITSHNRGEIVMTPEYQRLRDIKQLGSSSLVYSGAVHTRYEHCIGKEVAQLLRSRTYGVECARPINSLRRRKAEVGGR